MAQTDYCIACPPSPAGSRLPCLVHHLLPQSLQEGYHFATGGEQYAFNQLSPWLQVRIPPPAMPVQSVEELRKLNTSGVNFAVPPIPSPENVKRCWQPNVSRDDFFGCLVENGMPNEYRLSRACLQKYPNDGGAALICTSGRQDLMREYQRLREVKMCVDQGDRSTTYVANCLGKQFLGENERYYLACVTDNDGDLAKAAVCGVAKGLNPEQQIALACAVSTGGQPYAFVRHVPVGSS